MELRARGCTDHPGEMHGGTVLMKDGSFLCARAYDERLSRTRGDVGYRVEPRRLISLGAARPVVTRVARGRATPA